MIIKIPVYFEIDAKTLQTKTNEVIEVFRIQFEKEVARSIKKQSSFIFSVQGENVEGKFLTKEQVLEQLAPKTKLTQTNQLKGLSTNLLGLEISYFKEMNESLHQNSIRFDSKSHQ